MTTRSQITGSALDGSNSTTPYNWDAVTGTTATVVSGKYELNASLAGASTFEIGPTHSSTSLITFGGMGVKIIQRFEWEPKVTPTVTLALCALQLSVGCKVDNARKLMAVGLGGPTNTAAGASSLANHFIEVEIWFDGAGEIRLVRVYEDTMTYKAHVVEAVCIGAGGYILQPSSYWAVGSSDAKQNARQVLDNVDFLMVPSDN